MEQAAAVGGDMLVVTGAGAEEVAELVVAPAEALGRGEALEAAHASDAAFDAAMVLFQAIVMGWPAPLPRGIRLRGQPEEQEKRLEAQADRQKELAGLSNSVGDFCQRVQQGLAQASFKQRRSLVELLIDRVIVTDGEVEIRYVMPTARPSEQVRFCHLRLDYLHDVVEELALP